MDWSCRPSLGPRICRTYWKYKSWGSIIVLQTQKTYLFEDCTVILVHFALSLTSSCWFFFFVSSKSFFVSCVITLVFFSSEYLVRSCYFPPYVLPTQMNLCWSPWSMIRYAIFSPITITMIVIHGHMFVCLFVCKFCLCTPALTQDWAPSQGNSLATYPPWYTPQTCVLFTNPWDKPWIRR